MATAAGINAGFNSAGMAVQSIFGAKASKAMAAGYRQSAAGYLDAAGYARENAELTRQSTQLQLESSDRQIYKTIGGQQSDVAGSGFKASGTALDLLADSTAQGELTMDLIQKQGDINLRGYLAQEAMYKGQAALAMSQAEGAEASASGSMISGIIHGASSLASFGMG